jgi:hypothetical protein
VRVGQFPVVGRVIHGEEYITLFALRVDDFGLEWCVFVSAEVDSEGVILDRAL